MLPEYLIWEVVFLFSCDPRWWEARWLQRLLQPHSKQRKAVLVQAKKHLCELVHQAPRCPASDALERAVEKFDSGDLIPRRKEEMFDVREHCQLHIREVMKLLCCVMCKWVTWCFSPPARPGSAAFHPPASLWPTEARLSSVATVQSTARTQKQSAHWKTKWLIHKTGIFLQVLKLCARVRLQRTSMLTLLWEPLEIWATELLKKGEGVRSINKLLEDGVKHLQFVLCTDRHIFCRNCSKTPGTVCRGVCLFKQCENLPQWNTALTSRLSDKNKSGFRLRA